MFLGDTGLESERRGPASTRGGASRAERSFGSTEPKRALGRVLIALGWNRTNIGGLEVRCTIHCATRAKLNRIGQAEYGQLLRRVGDLGSDGFTHLEVRTALPEFYEHFFELGFIDGRGLLRGPLL